MLYYLHGYQSSPTGTKAALFKNTLQAVPLTYRDCAPEDLVIPDCLNRISQAIQNDAHVTLIGSSLGGFLAASTALSHVNVKQLVLLNPAIIPPQTNVRKIHSMPQRILKDMIHPPLFKQKIHAPIIILRGTYDTVVPDHWIYFFAVAQEAAIQFLSDDHQFTKNLEKLPTIISHHLTQ